MDGPLRRVTNMFDYPFDGTTEVVLGDTDDLPDRDGAWGIGVIVGPSGSGKSSLAGSKYGITQVTEWDNRKAVVSQVPYAHLSAVGFNSVKSWCKPRSVLSTGEGFRADAARVLGNNTCIDEWTSVVDRSVAISCSRATGKFVRKSGMRGVVLVTCHRDIIPWLEPDWVYDTSRGMQATVATAPRIEITFEKCQPAEWWPMFSEHHYLSGDINKAAECYLAKWGDNVVGFSASLSFPSGAFSNAYREHRLVVLPEFQGLGIGVRLSEYVAQIFLYRGKRYFSKTSHPRLGGYRDSSYKWRATSKNHMARKDYNRESVTKESKYKHRHAGRECFSHEYMGDPYEL